MNIDTDPIRNLVDGEEPLPLPGGRCPEDGYRLLVSPTDFVCPVCDYYQIRTPDSVAPKERSDPGNAKADAPSANQKENDNE